MIDNTVQWVQVVGVGGREVSSSSRSGSTPCSSKYGNFWFKKNKMALDEMPN